MGFRTILAVATLTLSWVACVPGLTWADRLPQELVPGQQVKVEGASSADGWFHASQVTLRDVEGIAKVEGLIDFAASDHKRLRVVGFDVVIDAATGFRLKDAQEVTEEIEGVIRSARLGRDDNDSLGRQPLTIGNVVIRTTVSDLPSSTMARGRREAQFCEASGTDVAGPNAL